MSHFLVHMNALSPSSFIETQPFLTMAVDLAFPVAIPVPAAGPAAIVPGDAMYLPVSDLECCMGMGGAGLEGVSEEVEEWSEGD